jgi:hypothetical protein
MNTRKLSVIAGSSYLIIFFAAIFANFSVLESISKAPLATIQQSPMMVRLGILAFLFTVVFDVIVAWALNELYKNHLLSNLSTYFRMMHAAIMAVALYSLPFVLNENTDQEILMGVQRFKTIWLIGLFFFGAHLILLGNIIKGPRIIAVFLVLAGTMYMVDTIAHFLLANYQAYSSIFLALVAVPSIVGEMAFAIWLLARAK